MADRVRGLRILSRPGHPDFLDLEWDRSLTEWRSERLVDVARGVHRHVVQFVDYDGALYALKELPPRIADREYRLLRRLAEASLPVVEVVGVANRRDMAGTEPLEDVLITRYLDYSLPYRTVFTHPRGPYGNSEDGADVRSLHERLLDAMAMLLVRMHLAGFFWGDCSLSNTLFRRDAGALEAYIVDVETGDWHPELTDGQRATDLEVTELNVAGGLMDLQAELGHPPDPDPVDTARGLCERYDRLWEELTSDVVIGEDERYRIDARVRRLNELGFDVDEIELVSTEDGHRLRMRTSVAERGYHRRRLTSLTGLGAQENQARSLLNDLANFRRSLERADGRPVPESVAAYRWMQEVFEPTVEAIPERYRAKLEPTEVFHEVLTHKWFLSEREQRDVGLDSAITSYMETILPEAPDERTVLATEEDDEVGWIGYG